MGKFLPISEIIRSKVVLYLLIILLLFFGKLNTLFAQIDSSQSGKGRVENNSRPEYDPSAKVKTMILDSVGNFKEISQDSVWTIGVDGKLIFTRLDSVSKNIGALNFNPKTGKFEQLSEAAFQNRKAYFDSLAKIYRYDYIYQQIYFNGTTRSIRSLSPAEYKMFQQDSTYHAIYANILDSLQKKEDYRQMVRDLPNKDFSLFPFSISIQDPQIFIQHIYFFLSKEKKWIKVNFGAHKNNPAEIVINIYDPKAHPSKLVIVGSDGNRIFTSSTSSKSLKPFDLNPITFMPSNMKKLNEVLKID